MLRLACLSMCLACLAACSLDVDARQYACPNDATCGAGYHCQAGVCVPGGGSGDGGSPGGPQGDITVNTGPCLPLNPTGGTFDGTWYLAGLCTGGEPLYPSVEPGCSAQTYASVSGSARGSLVFSGASATQSWTFSFQGTYVTPESCAGFVCGEVRDRLDAQPGVSATCTADGTGGCSCPFTQAHTETTTWSAAASGGLLSLTPEFTSAELYDFAVSGDRLVMRARASPRFQYTYVR